MRASSYVRPDRSRVDVFVDLRRGGVRRRQRVLYAAVDLRFHVGVDALEGAFVHQALQARGERLQRIVLAHPLALFLARAIVTIDVADVVAVVPVRLALEKRRPLAAPRAIHESLHRRVDRLHVLAVDRLRVDAEGLRARQNLARDRFAARRVLAVEIVLAHVDHRELPERGHVHRLVEQALAQRAVAEEAHGDLSGAAHLRRQRGAGGDARRAADDGVGAEVAGLRIRDVHRTALAAAVAGFLAEQLGEHPGHRRTLGQAVAVAAMRARDEVVALQRLADSDGYALLAYIKVGEARHLGALVELVDLLFEGADLRHLAVHVEVLLEIQPRLGHLGRHRVLHGPPRLRQPGRGVKAARYYCAPKEDPRC